MGQARTYTDEFKAQALKLAKEVGTKRAAEELGVSKNTLGTWVHKAKKGKADPGKGEQTPENALTLAAEVQELRKQLKAQEKEIKRLNELNEFLEAASAFFAARTHVPTVGSREKGTIKVHSDKDRRRHC